MKAACWRSEMKTIQWGVTSVWSSSVISKILSWVCLFSHQRTVCEAGSLQRACWGRKQKHQHQCLCCVHLSSCWTSSMKHSNWKTGLILFTYLSEWIPGIPGRGARLLLWRGKVLCLETEEWKTHLLNHFSDKQTKASLHFSFEAMVENTNSEADY